MKRVIAAILLLFALAGPVAAGGAATGIASHYGPGGGVAMNFCTWTLRHASGCGFARITSADTGLVVTAPIIDYCQCYTGTSDERIIDLQWDVVSALGLDLSRGLYPVTVEVVGGATSIPNTSMAENSTSSVLIGLGILFFVVGFVASLITYAYLHIRYGGQDD
jgi:hypothetical protein